MANRAVLAYVEETCRRVMGNDIPFEGKVIILLGDFRQTCLVIRRGSRTQVIDASIKPSPLFSHFKIFRLTEPIRNAEDIEFANFVDAIGDGAGPDIDLDMLAKTYTARNLTNLQVDIYNVAMLQMLNGTGHIYLAADSLKEVDDLGLTAPDSILDYAAKNPPPGLPPHSLTIKPNAGFRLLRNFSVDRGLVKNVRVVVIHTPHNCPITEGDAWSHRSH
jgi:hypothetical protein